MPLIFKYVCCRCGTVAPEQTKPDLPQDWVQVYITNDGNRYWCKDCWKEIGG